MKLRRVLSVTLVTAFLAGSALAGISDRLAECLAAISSIGPTDVIAGLRSGDVVGSQMVGSSRVDVVFSRYDAASGNVYVQIGDREVPMVDIDFWDDYADGARDAIAPRVAGGAAPRAPPVIPSSVSARNLPQPVQEAVAGVGARFESEDGFRRSVNRAQALIDQEIPTPRQVIKGRPVPFFSDAYESVSQPAVRRAGEVMHAALQDRQGFGSFVTDIVAETAERLCRKSPVDCGRLAAAPGWRDELFATLQSRAQALGWDGIGRLTPRSLSPQEFFDEGIKSHRGLFLDEAFQGDYHGSMTHLFQVIYAGDQVRRAGVGITAAQFFDGLGGMDYVHGGLAWANLFDDIKTPTLNNPAIAHVMLLNAGAL